MPTWDQTSSFRQDLKNLTPARKLLFKAAVAKFVADLGAARFRKGLRVKKMSGNEDIWEMAWDNDGRATFEYGDEVKPGEHHIVWRRIGTHEIYGSP